MSSHRGWLDDVRSQPCAEIMFAISQGKSSDCLARDFSLVLSIAAATAFMAAPVMAPNQVIVRFLPQPVPFFIAFI